MRWTRPGRFVVISCKSLKSKIYAKPRVDDFIRGGPCMSGLPRSSHALVTGGGRGIGREIAARLARAGVTVTVLGRNPATLDDAITAGPAHFPAVADGPDQAAVTPATS